MKLNVSGQPTKLKLGKQEQQQKQEHQPSTDIYKEARQKLYDEFIQDISDTAMDNNFSEKQQQDAQKRYRQLKIKRNILFGCICITFIGITFFGVYNTFLKHKLTYKEIAYIANAYNGKTNFAEDGVQGYLSTNMPNVITSGLISLRSTS